MIVSQLNWQICFANTLLALSFVFCIDLNGSGRIPMDRGAWWAAVHGITKSWDTTEQLSAAQPSWWVFTDILFHKIYLLDYISEFPSEVGGELRVLRALGMQLMLWVPVCEVCWGLSRMWSWSLAPLEGLPRAAFFPASQLSTDCKQFPKELTENGLKCWLLGCVWMSVLES